jgi:putative ABC transport system permease protein
VSLWRQFTHGVRALARRSRRDRDVDDEIQHYLEQSTAAHLARGLPPQLAARAARLELGSLTSTREAVRTSGWENIVETVLTDLRYAARRLKNAPVFTSAATLTLALGIGGATAVFSAVNPILFEPLPYPEPRRLVMLWENDVDGARGEGSFGMYSTIAEQARSFEGIAAVRAWHPTLTGADQPERLSGQRVSASYFGILKVAPTLGRDFQHVDDVQHGPRVVIISDALWRRRFSADPTIIGRPIRLDDDQYSVVGVMPNGFENVVSPNAEVWTPLQYGLGEGRAWGHHLRLIGRLRSSINAQQATQDLNVIGRGVLESQTPPTYRDSVKFSVTSLHEDMTRGVRSALLAMLAAVTLVVLIASVNVTNLLLARGIQRRSEFALRSALGAASGRLIRQQIIESLLLAVVGGALGMAIAWLGVEGFTALRPADLPRAHAVAMDGAVFVFGFGMTTLLGIAIGLTPAIQAARSDPQLQLQQGSRRTVGRGRQPRLRRALVVAEVALALVLLVGTGLLLRSLQRFFAVSSGFDASRTLSMQVQLAGHRFDDDSATIRFFSEVLETVRQVPGVVAAGLTSQLPLSGDVDLYGVRFDPPAPGESPEGRGTYRYAVSPGYIEALRIPLKAGRTLLPQDDAAGPRVALISESTARRRLPGVDPIGRHLRIGDFGPYTVVGVVGDVKQQSLALSDADAVYTTPTQWRFADNVMSLVVRTRGDPMAMVPAIRQAVWSVDRDQPIVRAASMDDLLRESAAQRRFALIIFEVFAIVALALAAAGIYGVLAGSVEDRVREIGVRQALGASRNDILALILRQGAVLTGVGIAVGVLGAAAASRVLVALLFRVSPLDPGTYLGVIGVMTGVAALACVVPAWRASRIDPVRTLQAE